MNCPSPFSPRPCFKRDIGYDDDDVFGWKDMEEKKGWDLEGKRISYLDSKIEWNGLGGEGIILKGFNGYVLLRF